MAPSRSKPGARRTTDAQPNQFVFSLATPETSPGLAFATTLTPGTFKSATKRPAKSGAASRNKATRTERFLPAEPPIDPSVSSTSDSQAKKPEDTKRIPRPPNAFILFRSSFIKGNHVDAEVETNHSTLSKIAGLTWNNLPEDERQAWYDEAKAARALHKEKFPEYHYKPTNRDPKLRKGRQVGPKDEVRCQKIAQLLVEGLSGEELRSAMSEFDQGHVPDIITRFQAPVTEKSFQRRRSSAATVVPEPKAEEGRPRPAKRRRRSPPEPSDASSSEYPSDLSESEIPTRPSSPALDPDMPPLCDPPSSSSFHVFSVSDDTEHQFDFNSFSFDQIPDNGAPSPSPYSYDPLSSVPPSPSTSSLQEDYLPSPFLRKESPLHIDTTSFSSYDMSNSHPPSSSSASSDGLPDTPFYENLEAAASSSEDSPAPSYYNEMEDGTCSADEQQAQLFSMDEQQQHLSQQQYYDLPLEAYDPSSFAAQFNSFAPYQQTPCWMMDQQQGQQVFDPAPTAAWTAAWAQQQQLLQQPQEQDSCHQYNDAVPTVNITMEMAQYMMTQPNFV